VAGFQEAQQQTACTEAQPANPAMNPTPMQPLTRAASARVIARVVRLRSQFAVNRPQCRMKNVKDKFGMKIVE